MRRILQCKFMLAGLLGAAVLGAGIPMMVQAAPEGQTGSTVAESHHGNQAVQAQLKDVGAKVASARARNAELQGQVAQMEQQNADRRKQLQQRDDQIAALQKKLQAAGVPASAASGSH